MRDAALLATVYFVAAISVALVRGRYSPVRAAGPLFSWILAIASINWIWGTVQAEDRFQSEATTAVPGVSDACFFASFWLRFVFGVGLWLACISVRFRRLHSTYNERRAPKYPFAVQLLPQVGAWIALGIAYNVFLSSSPEHRAEASCAVPWPFVAVGASIHVAVVARDALLMVFVRDAMGHHRELATGVVLALPGLAVAVLHAGGHSVSRPTFGAAAGFLAALATMFTHVVSQGRVMAHALMCDSDFAEKFERTYGGALSRTVAGRRVTVIAA